MNGLYRKVMLIDDLKIDRYIAEKLLSGSIAEEVISFETAIEGLCYLRPIKDKAQLPELILLDIQMPELNGFDFLDLFSQLPKVVRENCHIVILSSSHDQSDHKKAAASPYVCTFINKPLDKKKVDLLRGLSMQAKK